VLESCKLISMSVLVA